MAAAAIIAAMAIALAATAWPMRFQPVTPNAMTARAGASLPPFRLILPVLTAMAAQISLVSFVVRLLPFVHDGAAGKTDGAWLVFASVVGGVVGPLVAHRLVSLCGFAVANTLLTAICVTGGLGILTRASFVPLLFCAVSSGIATGAISTLIWQQFSDAVRRGARLTGHRSDLASFALLTATIKLGSAIAGWLLGRWLDGFEAGEAATYRAIALATISGGVISIVALGYGHRNVSRGDCGR